MNVPLLDDDEVMIDLELAMEDEEQQLLRELGKKERLQVDLIQFELSNGQMICWVAMDDPFATILDIRGIKPLDIVYHKLGDLVVHYKEDIDNLVDEIKNL